MKTKDKRFYERPAMTVMEIHQTGMLTESTGGSGTLSKQSPYTDGGDPFEEE